MEKERLINFIENSFIKDLLNNPSITDVSYNGENIFYQDNMVGRVKSSLEVTQKEVLDFIRQIANLSDNQFSYTDPILDMSIGRYRINATHMAIARKNRANAITFSIRIGYDELRIKEDNTFIKDKAIDLLKLFLNRNKSIVIGGLTSSGKTEFQKYLISKLKPATRVIVIDNVDELDSDYINKSIDLQTWLNLEKFKNINFDNLIKNALRNNPDYLVVSEARGEEMLSILNSAMSGHPTITTLHSKDIYSMYHRMTRLCMLKNQNLKFNETLEDIFDQFKLLIYLKKEISKDGKVIRYVDQIATNRFKNIRLLFKYPNTYYQIPNSIKYDLNLSDEEFLSFKTRWESNNA